MACLALVLDDLALAILRDADATPEIAASVIRAVPGDEPVGAPAASELRRRPREVSTRHWLQLATHEAMHSAAGLARAELIARLAGAANGASVVVAVPPHFDTEALGYVLGALQGAGLSVVRLIDSAALRCAALGLEREALVIDVGLHHLAVARVRSEEEGCRRTALRWRTGAGWLALLEGALQLAGDAMVRRHRFDPLHDGATEQALFDLLPAATETAARRGRATLTLERAGRPIEVELSRDQFAARSQPILSELLALAHTLRPAGAPLDILVGERLARWPGFVQQLEELRDCDLHVLPEDHAVRAAAALASGERDAGRSGMSAASVPLLRRVPRFAVPIPALADAGRRLGGLAAAADTPTHLLHAGHAYPLRGTILEIGRAPDARGLALPDGIAGLSRLHCTLRDEAGEIVLVDHSRYGSWVNGERVVDRVRLRAGDVLRVGDPGVEFSLIAVGADTGTSR